jgi:hypothetical protein
VPFQARRQHGDETLDDPRCRNVGRHDNQQAVAAVFPPAAIPRLSQGGLGHGQDFPPDDLVGLGATLVRGERHHVRTHHRTVLAGQHDERRPQRGRGVTAAGTVHGRPPGHRVVAEIMTLGGPALAQPGVDLLLDDLEDSRVRADERREVGCPHDQGHHRLQGHHGGGAGIHLQGGSLADQLAGPAYRHHPLGVVVADPDLDRAAEDYGRVVAVFPLLHEPGAGGEYPLMSLGPECPLLIGGEGVPENDHGLVLFC